MFACICVTCKCIANTLKDALIVLERPQPNIKQLCAFLLQPLNATTKHT